MALSGITGFAVFGLTALVVGSVMSALVTIGSLPFLVAKAPRQTVYALAEEITGESTTSYLDISFTLSYGSLLPVYGFSYIAISLPYVWFVHFSLGYPVYWLAAFPALMTGLTVAVLGIFARGKQLDWTKQPRLRDRLALSLYVLFITAVIGIAAYVVGFEVINLLDTVTLPL